MSYGVLTEIETDRLPRLDVPCRTLDHLEAICCKFERLLEMITETEDQLANDVYVFARTAYSAMNSPATVPGLIEQKGRLIDSRGKPVKP